MGCSLEAKVEFTHQIPFQAWANGRDGALRRRNAAVFDFRLTNFAEAVGKARGWADPISRPCIESRVYTHWTES